MSIEQPPEPRASASARESVMRRLRQIPKLPRISWRDLAATLGPVLLISAAAILLALHFVRPAPPHELIISSGPAGSSFATNAQKYAKLMAANGVTLKILPSEGSLDNLGRLIDGNPDADVGFVASGIAGERDLSDLVSLGSVFYQPIMIFYTRAQPLQRLSELEGKHIAIGPEGSGTRFLALALLKANGIEPGGKTHLDALESDAAIKALTAHKLDAIVLTGDSASSTNIRALLHADGVHLFDFPQAEAYTRRFSYLSKIDIPAGAFDLGDNLPAKDISLLATTVELVARSDLHPALSDLLIGAAREVNGRATLMQKAGEFPSPREHEFAISDDATRFYTSGKGFAYRYLPFWLASLVDRAVVVLVPLLVVLVPGLRLMPTLYNWRIRNRIYRHYGDLMALERAAIGPMNEDERAALLKQLGEIEKSVIAVRMPGAFAEQIYILRQHIKFVHAQLSKG